MLRPCTRVPLAVGYGIPKIHNVQQAMASPYWPLIREGMEAEILGKLANKAFSVVPRKPGMRVMKSKWCIDFKFEKDGSIKSIKCRFVGCGYSQIEGADFDKTYAATLSGCCLRLWCSIVADEDLETDSIDAVKAFTQSDVDRELHVEMPIGFAVQGCVLLLHKALEGIKQGSYLWFQKNKHAWNKCGMHADPVGVPAGDALHVAGARDEGHQGVHALGWRWTVAAPRQDSLVLQR